MKLSKQPYLQPTVKVVLFKVGDGFDSVVNILQVESESPNFETVSENSNNAGEYGNYFVDR
ncbi:MAG: hypothetical protein II633_00090 [Bacteroidales bacterium]|nr:hypothetical protein [Bacteroidales bacterium]